MEALFDHQGQFSVPQFDDIVRAFYAGDTTTTQPILTAFNQHPDSWQAVDQILERSNVLQAKFIALQILEKFISTRWKHLAQEQRLAIRDYIGSVIVSLSSSNITMQTEKVYLSKLNIVLVEIVKKEWPDEWSSFINEMIASAHANPSICENNMTILRLLSEEVFEASEETQAEWKTRKLKGRMMAEFGPVIELCRQVLMNPVAEGLIKATLESLSHFLKWIPPTTLFNTDLMVLICNQMSSNDQKRQFMPLVLKCYNEVAGRQDFPVEIQEKLILLLQGAIRTTHEIILLNGGIESLYNNVYLNGQEILYDYTLFITSALSCYGEIINSLDTQLLTQVHQDLLVLSSLDDIEIWRMCAEYWVYLTSSNCNYGNQCRVLFPDLRRIAFKCIPSPDNVLVVDEHEDDLVLQEYIDKSENPELYKVTKQLLCNLAVLDINDTGNVFQERLTQIQTENIFQSWKNLSQLGWAIGAISHAIKNNATIKEEGYQLICQSLDQLERLCINGKPDSSEPCMLYIASQYPQILCKRQDIFIKTLNLIGKYLHNKEIDIQKFATHILVEVCHGIQQNSSLMDQQEGALFLEDLLTHLPTLITDLDSQQTCEVYRAVGYVFSVLSQQYQHQYIQRFMDQPNQMLKSSLYQRISLEEESLRVIANVLRINIAVCEAIGEDYGLQLKCIYEDLCNAYRIASQTIGSATPLLCNLRERIKELVDALLTIYIKSKPSLSTDDQDFINPLLHLLVASPPSKNDVSNIFSILLEKHKNNKYAIQSLVEIVYHQVFERIYFEIKSDFTSYYDKRPGFFRLVQALTNHAFTELLSLFQEDKFTQLVESILWGIQHPSHELSNLALETCNVLFDRIYNVEDEDQQNALYTLYYMKTLDIILHTITDHDRRTQFELQSKILARLLELVQQGEIYTQLYSGGVGSNADYVQEHVRSKLIEVYPSLPQNQIDMVAQGMLEYSDDIDRFRTDLIDFMADFRSSDDFSNNVILDTKTELELLASLTRQE